MVLNISKNQVFMDILSLENRLILLLVPIGNLRISYQVVVVVGTINH